MSDSNSIDTPPPSIPRSELELSLVALEEAKARVARARAAEKVAAKADELARKRAANDLGAGARMVREEAERADRLGLDPKLAEAGAKALVDAHFVRERALWVRDERRAMLTERGWVTGLAGVASWHPVGATGLAGQVEALRTWAQV